jgi:hypothetical protein
MLEAGELDAAVYHVEQAIIAAVEEEREACAKIADDAVEGYATFADIASDIRARGNKDR